MGIEDSYTAFQLDMAMALKGEYEDKKFTSELAGQVVDNINESIAMLAKVWGAKVKVKAKPKPSKTQSVISDEPPPLNDLINQFGGQGVVLNIEGKK